MLRTLRTAILLAVAAFVLLQPDVRSHISSTAEGAGSFAVAAGDGGGAAAFACEPLRVIDGDTLDCAGERVRLAGIDAPEMTGHCRSGRTCVDGDPHAARAALQAFAAGGLTCAPSGRDTYGRTIARCEADGRDASCALIASGHAEARYGRISCAGRA
ncbi:thermonuclease family protein [Maricaulaceae bacterium MS644]